MSAAPCLVQPVQQYKVSGQGRARALKRFAGTSGREVIGPGEILAGKRIRPVSGTLSAEAAMARLLAGTGLRAETVEDAFVIRRAANVDPTSRDVTGRDAIVITGTRIRGTAPVGSDVITIDREAIERSDHATTQDIAQDIPQNFGGAPNEATGRISLEPNSGRNIGDGTSRNLR